MAALHVRMQQNPGCPICSMRFRGLLFSFSEPLPLSVTGGNPFYSSGHHTVCLHCCHWKAALACPRLKRSFS